MGHYRLHRSNGRNGNDVAFGLLDLWQRELDQAKDRLEVDVHLAVVLLSGQRIDVARDDDSSICHLIREK